MRAVRSHLRHCTSYSPFLAVYQYTKLERYLDAARNIAAYFLRRAAEKPAYLVWLAQPTSRSRRALYLSSILCRDFDAPASPTPPADSSAAMIASAGLQVLATAEMSIWNTTGAERWLAGAQTLITQTAGYAWKPTWQSLLSNGTRDNNASGNAAARSNNTGLPYGSSTLLDLLVHDCTEIGPRRLLLD